MMKHCDNCNKDFDTLEPRRPVCGGGLRKADATAGGVAALMLLLVVFLY